MEQITAHQRLAKLRQWQERLAADETDFIPTADLKQYLTLDELSHYQATLKEHREQYAKRRTPVFSIDGDAHHYWKRARIIPARLARAQRSRNRSRVIARIDKDAERLLEEFEALELPNQSAFKFPNGEEELQLYRNELSVNLPVPYRYGDMMGEDPNTRRTAQLALLDELLTTPLQVCSAERARLEEICEKALKLARALNR